jgi:excisionase family DNA binding protein
MTAALDTILPSKDDATRAAEALPALQSYLTRHRRLPESIHLRVEEDDGETVLVPAAALRVFVRILAHMAAGHGVAVVPSTAELTTQQATDLLNVSRPYLIGLLNDGKIGYRMVGTHRRVLVDSLLRHKREDDLLRLSAADELAAMKQDLDLS